MKIIGAVFDGAREGMDDTSWISRSLKIILKICFKYAELDVEI